MRLILHHKLKHPCWQLPGRAHNNSRIAQTCVFYRGGGFLQWSLCCPVAKQPSQHWCSCGDSKAMRKGSFKGADPVLSALWCQWEKSRQQLMYCGAFCATMERKGSLLQRMWKQMELVWVITLLVLHHPPPPHQHNHLRQGHKPSDK